VTSKKMTKKNKIILITALFVAGAVVAVPLTVRWAAKPNFAKMSPRQIREYFDSNEFRDANELVRRAIRQQIGEAMRARMESEVKGYFVLPEDERTDYLDKVIDEMQARRVEFRAARDPNRPPPADRFARFGPPNADRPAGFGPPPADRSARFGSPDAGGSRRFGQQGAGQQRPFRRPDPARMRARAERGSAQARVQMMQFRRALQARMQQRGIQGPMMGPGGPGGGFGGPGFGPPPG
jgi:hypothetical protein